MKPIGESGQVPQHNNKRPSGENASALAPSGERIVYSRSRVTGPMISIVESDRAIAINWPQGDQAIASIPGGRIVLAIHRSHELGIPRTTLTK